MAMEAIGGLHGHPPFVQEKKNRESLEFTSIDDAVEVDVDLVRESEEERSSRVVKMNKSCCLNLF